MKKYYRMILMPLAVAVIATGLGSCKKYLDAAPATTIDNAEAFQNFRNFQGFTEELYNAVPIVSASAFHNNWNFGEDELWQMNDNRLLAYQIDQGDFWGWENPIFGSWFKNNSGASASSNDRGAKGHLYKLAWYSIRKANVGLANLHLLVDATPEEKRLIEGQLLFFRGWFHFMLMEYWGGLPYVDVVLPSDEAPRIPRLNYQQTADKVAADLRKAADLLPIDWDQIPAGNATQGRNDRRINKIMALGFLGKNLLWAGSPLMNEESTGVNAYNVEYCKQAADVFGEALAIVESTKRYELIPFSRYTEIFYTFQQNNRTPGSVTEGGRRIVEAIFQENLHGLDNRWRFNQVNDYRPNTIKGTGLKAYPTANYINYYGMKNGHPLPANPTQPDADSGWDPRFPWKDRDPRFYHDIVFDGEQVVTNGANVGNNEFRQYASLFTNGHMRTNDGAGAAFTGYMLSKFTNKRVNNWEYLDGNTMVLSFMRLPDLYLMYAEAASEGYNDPMGKAPGYGKTAVDAINFVRDRPGLEVGHVAAKFTASQDLFRQEYRRERAVELAFEGFRFVDLRRWKLIDKSPYTLKTAVQFSRVTPNALVYADPKNAQVQNFRETILLERKYTSRHYWFPFPLADVNIYEGFSQNPGW